jgi:hypothetical protein
MANCLLCNILKVVGLTGVFYAYSYLCRIFLPVTSKQKQLIKDDPKKGRTAYERHISCAVAASHGLIATIFAVYISFTEGITFGQESKPIHNWSISVSAHLSRKI